MSFNPYSMNGGTILGIAGDDYCLLASDTRLCEEESYNVLSHDYSHLYPMYVLIFLYLNILKLFFQK